MRSSSSIAVIAALALGACGDISRLPDSETTGPNPTLPEPTASFTATASR